MDQTLTGVTNTTKFFLAADAVRAADGSIVCRPWRLSVPLPRFTATWNASYRNGPLSFGANFWYTGSGLVDRTTAPNDLPQLKVKGQILVNTNLGYQMKTFGGTYDLFFNVENLTNKLAPASGNVSYYDTIGRTYRVGVRFRY